MILIAGLSIFLDMLFGGFMLATGLVVGWWLSHRGEQGSAEAEKARLAMDRLRELTNSMAQDVGEHSSRVLEINTELTQVSGEASIGEMLGPLAKIVEANERLQQQLATAEVKLQRQAEELQTQAAVARTDALTSLFNRRAFDDELTRRFAEWQRRKTIVSLVMLDVDHFKKFNDTHGHQAGDEVLKGVGRVLGATMREMDLVARYGGEEFAIILPVTNIQEGLRAAERARAAIEAAIFAFDKNQLRVTVSVGVAQVVGSDTGASMLKRADEALYASKKAGRNCIHYHDGEKCCPASPEQLAPAKPNKPAPAVKAAPAAAPASPKTELASSATFSADLKRRLVEFQRFNSPLSVMLVDIDDYKGMSERFGGQSGEWITQSIADSIAKSLGQMDVASRHALGQFAVMMPGSTLDDACKVAERIREAVAQTPMQVKGADCRLTISLGLAEAVDGDDYESLIQRADAALFASKGAGRNCAHLHNGQKCEPLRALALAC